MLTDKHRATIEALTDAELEYELARGPASRFQGAKFAYVQAVYNQRQQAQAGADQAATLQVAQAGVKATNRSTRWVIVGIVVAAIVGLLAAAATYWPRT